MNESQQKFRERLLDAEKSLPTEKYRNAMAELQERKLSATQRITITVVSAGALAVAVYMGWLAIVPPGRLPMIARLGLAFGVLCSLAVGGLAARVARRGVMKRKVDPGLVTGIIFVDLVIFATLMLILMGQVPDAAKRVEIGSSAILFFGMGCMFLIVSKMEQMELRTTEKLLEIELQVQQLAEEVRPSART